MNLLRLPSVARQLYQHQLRRQAEREQRELERKLLAHVGEAQQLERELLEALGRAVVDAARQASRSGEPVDTGARCFGVRVVLMP